MQKHPVAVYQRAMDFDPRTRRLRNFFRVLLQPGQTIGDIRIVLDEWDREEAIDGGRILFVEDGYHCLARYRTQFFVGRLRVR